MKKTFGACSANGAVVEISWMRCSMKCDYFVVPYAKRKLVAIGNVYKVFDREKFIVVVTSKLDWMTKVPAALRFFDDGSSWGFTAYAKGKEIAARTDDTVTGKLDAVVKLFRIDGVKLEKVRGAEAFRKLIGFSRYALEPASFEAMVDEGNMQRLVDATKPVKQARAKPTAPKR